VCKCVLFAVTTFLNNKKKQVYIFEVSLKHPALCLNKLQKHTKSEKNQCHSTCKMIACLTFSCIQLKKCFLKIITTYSLLSKNARKYKLRSLNKCFGFNSVFNLITFSNVIYHALQKFLDSL